jgi:tRNA nucleotidyltransferase (CCA-adding enzyme)
LSDRIKLYKVGGCVRDEILGLRSKDIDYSVEAPSFAAMEEYIAARGKIYVSKPEFLTIRAKIGNEDSDYVLCRKDGAYSDGRRPDDVEIGTIYDDLARRDFTMNAIAKVGDEYIDPHGGRTDIARRLIRAVGSAEERFSEDALRMLRAMRFHITMGFKLHWDILACFLREDLLTKLSSVSVERKQVELSKCFRADTMKTLDFLAERWLLPSYLFSAGDLWLEPTLKARA